MDSSLRSTAANPHIRIEQPARSDPQYALALSLEGCMRSRTAHPRSPNLNAGTRRRSPNHWPMPLRPLVRRTIPIALKTVGGAPEDSRLRVCVRRYARVRAAGGVCCEGLHCASLATLKRSACGRTTMHVAQLRAALHTCDFTPWRDR